MVISCLSAYFLSRWGYKVINGWLTNSSWSAGRTFLFCVSLLLVTFICAHMAGMELRAYSLKNEVWGYICGVIFGLLFLFFAIYPWCIGMYGASKILLRIIWSYFSLGAGGFAFLMILMVGFSK